VAHQLAWSPSTRACIEVSKVRGCSTKSFLCPIRERGQEVAQELGLVFAHGKSLQSCSVAGRNLSSAARPGLMPGWFLAATAASSTGWSGWSGTSCGVAETVVRSAQRLRLPASLARSLYFPP
jgi:hypothetical protein